MSWDQERWWYWRGRHCLEIKREGSTGEVGIVLRSRERQYWRGRHCLGIKREGTTGEVGIVLGSRERVVLER